MFVFCSEKVVASSSIVFFICSKWVQNVLLRVSKLVLYFAYQKHVELCVELLLLFLLLLLIGHQVVCVELNLLVYNDNAVCFTCERLCTYHRYLGNVHFTDGDQYLERLLFHCWTSFALGAIFSCYLGGNQHSVVNFSIIVELVLSVRLSYLCSEENSIFKHVLFLEIVFFSVNFIRA